MKCMICGETISDTAKFCRFCGNKVETVVNCPKCGAKLESGSSFCEECGTPIGGAPVGGTPVGDASAGGKASAKPSGKDSIPSSSEKYSPVKDFELKKNKDGTITISKYNGRSENVAIPPVIAGRKVTRIGDFAFFGVSKIKSLTIPDSVTYIADGVFDNCRGLTVTYKGKQFRYNKFSELYPINPQELYLLRNYEEMNKLGVLDDAKKMMDYIEEHCDPEKMVPPTPEEQFVVRHFSELNSIGAFGDDEKMAEYIKAHHDEIYK